MRKCQLIDLGWLFCEGDQPRAQLEGYDDSRWRRVDLPHDWSVEGEFSADAQTGKQGGFLPCGFGWYRKRLPITEEQLKQRLFLEFEGVYMNSDVWINGQHLGHRCNGYVTFFYEISDYLKAGENLLAVRVDCSSLPNCRWYSGCGVYRHVRLISRDKLSVAHWGTFIRTPKVSDELAQVDLDVAIENKYDRECEVCVKNIIIDQHDDCVAENESVILIPEASQRVVEGSMEIVDPHLWSCKAPYLYNVITYVYLDGDSKDCHKTSFGVREIDFTPEKGFLLNGEKFFLKGLNIHHDLGCLGAAAHDRAIERRLRSIKDVGFNAIRLSHNPHAPYLLECCDRMGFLVFNECFDKWKDYQAENGGKTYSFADIWREDLRDFILRDRNHPSVFIWSVGNETCQQFGQAVLEGPLILPDYGVGELKEKTDLVRKLDPTRKSTCALYPARKGGVKFSDPAYLRTEPIEMAFHMDVVSSNYMQQFYERDHEKYPGMIFIASEVTTNGGAKAWFSVNHDYCCGIFFWGGVDYLGESISGWPLKGWEAGLIDLCDNPKPISHYAKSLFVDEPFVYVGVVDSANNVKNPGAFAVEWNDVLLEDGELVQSHWNWAENTVLKVVVYANCDEVKLFLNDRQLGEQILADCEMNFMTWQIPFEAGVLKAVGYNKGDVVGEHSITTAGEPEKLKVSSERNKIQADGMDIVYFNIEAVDNAGVLAPQAGERVYFKVDGPARIVGVDNADMNDVDPFQASDRKLFNGKCLLVVRSTGERGTISITAKTEALGQEIATIQATI